MNDERWIDCKDELPPEGVIVETQMVDGPNNIHSGDRKRIGRKWYFNDCHYDYRPTHWRKIPASTTPKLYIRRDTEALGEHYQRHISAMTTEGLYGKSRIAAELAYRDMLIERLTKGTVKHEAIEK
jgi:hypothetical protein